MPFPKIKIYNDLPSYPTRTLIEINGKKLPYVQSISYEVSVSEVPRFDISMYGIPDIEIDNAIVHLDCCPENIGQAARILINAIRTIPAMREAWISSIVACIDHNFCMDTGDVTLKELATTIVDWMVEDDGKMFSSDRTDG